MSSALAIAETNGHDAQVMLRRTTTASHSIEALSNKNEDEVLAFLAHRPVHTVVMSGFIRDNGLATFSNRGTFFGCRNPQGRLEGVTLVGQKTLLESRSPSAFETLGRLMPGNHSAHLVRIEQQKIEPLLGYYAAAGRHARLLRKEILLEQCAPIPGVEAEPNLRLANADDLADVAAINAGMAEEETGLNPMTKDRQGMLERTERRIAQRRVWILTHHGTTIFKADVVCDTPEVAFIEGVFVRYQERRKGHGLRCMNQLAHNLVTESKSICLVVNEENSHALAFYDKAGFKVSSRYSTAYFSAV